MFSYLYWLLGYKDDYTWCEKQRSRKYKVLKEIESKFFIFNHIHTDCCKCIDKYNNKILN